MNAACERVKLNISPDSLVAETPWTGGAFLYGLVCLYRPKHVVEIGSHCGSASCYMISALKETESGCFVGYELEKPRVKFATDEYANSVWPGGRWKFIAGDFFETYDDAVTDFAFIDIDPKSAYVKAYERLNLASSCVVVAHDLFLSGEGHNVRVLEQRLKDSGFETFGFAPARGFLLGVRQ